MDVDRYITNEAVQAAETCSDPGSASEFRLALRAALPHIIPAVRADSPEVAAAGLRTLLADAEAAIQRVRVRHQPALYDQHDGQDYYICGHCDGFGGGMVAWWPCPTIRALDGGDA